MNLQRDGEFVTEAFEYDGGRQVTVYVPPTPPEAIVFAGDGQRISRWGRLLAKRDVLSTMIVGVQKLTDETLRLHVYSPGFAPERFAAHGKFFVEDVRRWTESRFGLALPVQRTACWVSRHNPNYVRQWTPYQVRNHLEGKELQYALAERAKQLGFSKVIVVDEDLGRSGSGAQERVGFGLLLASVCQGLAGAVFALEASRLARNNRDWHHLVDLCALAETLLIDTDGIYETWQQIVAA